MVGHHCIGGGGDRDDNDIGCDDDNDDDDIKQCMSDAVRGMYAACSLCCSLLPADCCIYQLARSRHLTSILRIVFDVVSYLFSSMWDSMTLPEYLAPFHL